MWLYGKPLRQIKQAQWRDPGIVILTVIMLIKIGALTLKSPDIYTALCVKTQFREEITFLTFTLCRGFQMTVE